MREARLLAVGVVLAALACAWPAQAAPPPPVNAPSSPEHDTAFKSGFEQYEHGNYTAAIATWESLLATMGEERGYKVLYNLGLAHQAIGDVTRSIERFRAFEKQVARRPNANAELLARAEDARKRAVQLEAAHGAVNVHAPKRGGLVLTRLGTAEPRAAGYVVWLSPGRHTIELFVGTDHVRTVTIDVERGKAIDIDTSPPESAAPPQPVAVPTGASGNDATAATTPLARDTSATSSSTWLYIGAAATVVSMALPVSFYFVARGKRDDASALGTGNAAYADTRSSYQTWRTLYYGSYALPATLALATGLYVVLRPSSSRSTTSAALGVSPAGVAVSGHF